MSNGIELDGKTKLSSLVARTGVAVEPQNDYQRYYIKYYKRIKSISLKLQWNRTKK